MVIYTQIQVKYDVIGFHCWPEADGDRNYLADRHRHKFFYRVAIGVEHHDREIEFHDFLDFCKSNTLQGEMGRCSCEDMARHLIEKIADRWPNRNIEVEVSEDGEVSAVLKASPAQIIAPSYT